MTPDILQLYHESIALYLQSQKTSQSATTHQELLTGLCSSRGMLNFSGQQGSVGQTEEQVRTTLSPQELTLALQGIPVERLKERLLRFVQLSAEQGGDVSLIEPDAEREAAVEEGKDLLWERHDIECRLEGVRWWVAQREDLCAALTPVLAERRQQMAALDMLWKEDLAHFLPLNPHRRSHRDAMPRAQDFWWWALLADCDVAAVYRVAEGKELPSTHLQECGQCQTLLAELQQAHRALSQVKGSPRSHPEPADLIRLYYGETSGHEEAGLEWHLRVCERCRWECDAIRRSEEEEESTAARVSEGKAQGTAKPRTLVYALPLRADQPLAVAASAGQAGVTGLPGQMIYQDEELEVWVNEDGERVVLWVYGTDLRDLSALEVSEQNAVGLRTVQADQRQATEAVFTLGWIRELRGKRLRLSWQYKHRLLELCLNFDLAPEEDETRK
jgi:hypothetical protein